MCVRVCCDTKSVLKLVNGKGSIHVDNFKQNTFG